MARPLVIVVNTDLPFLEMMSQFLSEEGYEALPMYENHEAFETIRARKPRLVIIELVLTDPEAGMMILNKMRLEPGTAHIPVIIASTTTQLLRDNEEHLRAKGCEFLIKPFFLEELVSLVNKLAPRSDA